MTSCKIMRGRKKEEDKNVSVGKVKQKDIQSGKEEKVKRGIIAIQGVRK